MASLARALGDRALVELVEVGSRLHAVVVADGRAKLRPLAQGKDVSREIGQLRFSLGRLAGGRGSATSTAAYTAALDHSAHCLDELLLRPLLADLGARPLVIVPTGALHHLPWSVLPSCRDRAVTVTPSASQWLVASRPREETSGRTALLVAGPDCAGAMDEVADLSALLPATRTLLPEEATVSAVTEALAGVELAHLIAHGTFRADNPLFSSLRLADGPLTVYDLELLPRVPSLLVLSACDGGLAAVAAGDELVGLASALLTFGAQTVVASVTAVPEDLTHQLMVEFHRGVADGTGPAAALAAARTTVQLDIAPADPRRPAVTGFGAG